MVVSEYFNISPLKLTDGDLGVEVEVEGRGLPLIGDRYWRTDNDGSLKGEAFEYVLKRPLSFEDAAIAMDALGRAYVMAGATINDSVRCGVHVHINVQKLTIPQLYNFITLYSVFEEIMLDYCGVGRNGNLFCLPLNRSAGVIYTLRACAENTNFMALHSDEYRYCALNVKALGDYGSVEFRALRGGPDLTKIKLWYTLLLHLRNVACTYYNPTEIIIGCSMKGCSNIFNEVCGSFIDAGMFSKSSNIARKLKDGIQSAQAIAFSCDWNKYNEEVEL